MIYLYAIGGFLVGVCVTILAVIWLCRKEEQAAFRSFWGV
jgi:hypothetical protein